MDDRMMRLIADRNVHCTLRKQNQNLTWWWRGRLDEYTKLLARSDHGDPAVVDVVNRLFTMLKFVASPNNESRKQELIAQDWPSLEKAIRSLP